MEHFNKDTFIGSQLWAAICILAPKETSSAVGEFIYEAEGKTILCQNYGKTFGIKEIPYKKDNLKSAFLAQLGFYDDYKSSAELKARDFNDECGNR